MADLTNVSDDQLEQMIQQAQAHPLATSVAASNPTLQSGPSDLSHMSDDELEALIGKSQGPKQITGALREPAIAASEGWKGVLTALSMPGTLMNTYSRYIGKPLADKVLGGDNAELYGNFAAPHVLETARNLGQIDNPSLKPEGLGEEMLAAGSRGVGSVAPYALLPGASLARTLVGGGAAGVGEKVAEDWAPNHPLAASLLGAGAGMLAGNKGVDLLSQGANALRPGGPVSPLVEAMLRQRVTPRLLGDVSENPFWQKQQARLFDAPHAAAEVRGAGAESLGELDNAIERTAGNFGGATNATEAGVALQKEARNWYNVTRPQIEKAAWDPVDRLIPDTTPAPLTNYEKALVDIGNAPNRMQQTAKALNPDASAKAQELLLSLKTDVLKGSQPTWAEARYVRSLVGEARGNPTLAQSLGTQNLNKLYAALSKDLEGAAGGVDQAAVAAGGPAPGALAAFKNANRVTTASHAFQDNVLSRLISAPRNELQESILPQQATQNALSGGDTVLTGIRHQMPNGANELAAYSLRDAKLATPSWQNAAGDQASAGTFLTDLNKLRQSSPEGFEALFGPQKESVGDLARIAQSMKETQRSINTSKTASNSEAGLLTRTALGATAGKEIGEAFGPEGAPIGAVIGAGTGAVGKPLADSLMSKVVTSPTAARWFSTPYQTATARERLVQALAPVYERQIERSSQPPALPSR